MGQPRAGLRAGRPAAAPGAADIRPSNTIGTIRRRRPPCSVTLISLLCTSFAFTRRVTLEAASRTHSQGLRGATAICIDPRWLGPRVENPSPSAGRKNAFRPNVECHSRYSRSSRLAIRAHRRPRCNAGLSPRTATTRFRFVRCLTPCSTGFRHEPARADRNRDQCMTGPDEAPLKPNERPSEASLLVNTKRRIIPGSP